MFRLVPQLIPYILMLQSLVKSWDLISAEPCFSFIPIADVIPPHILEARERKAFGKCGIHSQISNQ